MLQVQKIRGGGVLSVEDLEMGIRPTKSGLIFIIITIHSNTKQCDTIINKYSCLKNSFVGLSSKQLLKILLRLILCVQTSNWHVLLLFLKKIVFYIELNSEKSWSLRHTGDVTIVHFESDFVMK